MRKAPQHAAGISALTVGKPDPKVLQDFLALKFALSRRTAKAMIDGRSVWVNRKCVWIARFALRTGDLVESPSQVVKGALRQAKASGHETGGARLDGAGASSPARQTGIESGRQAIDFAKRNSANQKYANAKFWAERVGQNLRRISVDSRTTVIVDPPRAGMEPNVPRWLAASKAPRILYVSCDPATLTRDLKTICLGYDIESVRWFNMFPRTARFETLVVLKRKTGD